MINKKIWMIVLLGMFMISSVYALGVTPARTPVDFEPSLSRTFTFEILNSENRNINLVLKVQGELAEYINLHSSKVSLSSSEGSQIVSYDVNLPSQLEPGDHLGEIVIMEVPDEAETSEAYVRATLAVVTQLKVYVPYPGKYANARMNIINANENGDVTFVFPVLSAGQFDLTSVKANVDIYNTMGEKVDSFTTAAIEVPTGQRKELIYKWKADVPVGNYRAVATLIYDEGTLNFEEIFSVGNQELVLESITVDKFSLGEIAKLEMLVENKWSEPIEDAYIETKILNGTGEIVSSFKSSNYDLGPLSKEVFISYWDTAGVSKGTYDTEVSINYAGKKSTNTVHFEVSKNDLKVLGLGYVISSGGDDSGNFLIIVLVSIIVLLILVNLLWFFFLRKRLHK
jgi:hypothetical protein